MVVAQGQQDDVALVDPDFLAQLAADVGEALGAVEAERFEAAVAEHLEDLCVFWERLVSGVLYGGVQRGERWSKDVDLERAHLGLLP